MIIQVLGAFLAVFIVLNGIVLSVLLLKYIVYFWCWVSEKIEDKVRGY